ncbi:MAG: carbohydrate kinase [Verrucomicrobia bacterium]|nr:carbohydrate kinase [Verrucomicrobiota bacterium]MBI3867447.1 carbohydrate kinase [Verrucomicrobiota bacterium]
MKFQIVAIGEVLWDLLPGGRQLGGAPANFAYHASALGGNSRLISRVGGDELGREALHLLKRVGVATDCVQVDETRPTGTVGVQVASDGQPRFTIHENVAWDAIRNEAAGSDAIAGAHAVCFGSLAQRSEPSRSTIRSLVTASPRPALRILDVNLRQHYFSPRLIEESLALANVLKLNDGELPRLSEIFHLEGDIPSRLSQLASRYNLRTIAYTRGSGGSLLFSEGRWSDHPGASVAVVDTVGAGDSFTAAMTLGLLSGWDLDRINEHANQVAAHVCSRAGAMPELPHNLRQMA